jgi:hypothetical protein
MHCEFYARTFDTFLLAISKSKASHLRELRSEFSRSLARKRPLTRSKRESPNSQMTLTGEVGDAKN